MKRYSQKKIDDMDYNRFFNLLESGKCKVDETRVVKKETYGRPVDNYGLITGGYIIYTVWFNYVLTFPENVIFEEEVYTAEVRDVLSFDSQRDAENYLSCVRRPSQYDEPGKRWVHLKEEYMNEILGTSGVNNYGIVAEIKTTDNANRYRLNDYNLYVNNRYVTHARNLLTEILHKFRYEFGEPTKIESVIEIVEKRYNANSDIDLDELIKDVEKLRNEKNKYVADEIKKSTEYILTLKKLL